MWNGNCFEVEIHFIRHGLTRYNEQKKYISFTDEGLSENGISQIMENVRQGKYPSAEKVFTSSLLRTGMTADLIYPGIDSIIYKELDEINFGRFEGKTYEDLKDNSDYVAWLNSGGIIKIPEGESREEFVARQDKAFKNILDSSKESNSVAVICHGGTIMSILSKYTDLEYYDGMTFAGGRVSCLVRFIIEDTNDVSISHFSIIYRDNS